MALIPKKNGAVYVEFETPAKSGQKSASLKKLKIVKQQIPYIPHGKKYLNHLKKGVTGYLY